MTGETYPDIRHGVVDATLRELDARLAAIMGKAEKRLELAQAADRRALRDYFAGRAMQSIIAAEQHAVARGDVGGLTAPSGVAAEAYEYADAMLKARELAAEPAEVAKEGETDEGERRAPGEYREILFSTGRASAAVSDTERPPPVEPEDGDSPVALLRIGRSCVGFAKASGCCQLCEPPVPGAHEPGCPVGEYMLATTSHGRVQSPSAFPKDEVGTLEPVVKPIGPMVGPARGEVSLPDGIERGFVVDDDGVPW